MHDQTDTKNMTPKLELKNEFKADWVNYYVAHRGYIRGTRDHQLAIDPHFLGYYVKKNYDTICTRMEDFLKRVQSASKKWSTVQISGPRLEVFRQEFDNASATFERVKSLESEEEEFRAFLDVLTGLGRIYDQARSECSTAVPQVPAFDIKSDIDNGSVTKDFSLGEAGTNHNTGISDATTSFLKREDDPYIKQESLKD